MFPKIIRQYGGIERGISEKSAEEAGEENEERKRRRRFSPFRVSCSEETFEREENEGGLAGFPKR